MSRKVSQNLRKRPELKLIAQQVKFDQLWNQNIHINGFQVIAATVTLYALQVTAAWIHRLEVRPIKMVIATLSLVCAETRHIYKRSTHHHHLASGYRIDMDGTSVVEEKEPGQQMRQCFIDRSSAAQMHLTIPEMKQHD